MEKITLRKVFIVDDESYVLTYLNSLVDWKKYDYNPPYLFKTAREALDSIGTLAPDLIMSDIRMPGMDGIEFAETVHSYYPNIKFVILSAYQDFGYAVKALKLGVIRYLVKPISIAELEKAIQSTLTPNVQEPSPDRISNWILNYIDSNLATASLKGVSMELGISQNHLSRLFHQETGNTFSEILSERRMAMAASLIEKGVSEKEAAESVGYSDIPSFRRTLASYLKDKL